MNIQGNLSLDKSVAAFMIFSILAILITFVGALQMAAAQSFSETDFASMTKDGSLGHTVMPVCDTQNQMVIQTSNGLNIVR